jgi:UDP-N-acetyl-D-mannosaminuronic acid dehydrogenase
MDKVCVVGLGYIGLPTASLLAREGFKVHGVDINPQIVQKINHGEIHIYEPDLDVLVKSAVSRGDLIASLEPAPADVFIIAVPTPIKEEYVPDISYVEAATRSIASYLEPGNLVILESTSPVGTTEQISHWLWELRPDLEAGSVYVAYCPERVLPGQILKELISNHRIVGGIDPASTEQASAFYQRFVKGKVLPTQARTAELAKLAENAFRDVNIAFANELSLICEHLNIDIWELRELANRHPRVNILKPGPGVGGHCVAVDPWFIIHSAPEKARLLRTAREVNDSKPHQIVDRVKAVATEFNQPVIACLGLAYKANIDDLRESPAVEIVRELATEAVGHILSVEPHISCLPASLDSLGSIQLVELEVATKKADILVLLVDHQAFKTIDREQLKGKTVIDTRGIWQ